jgi:uncharacterized protein DUF4157
VSVPAAIAAQRCGIERFDLPLDGITLVPMPSIVEKALGPRVHAITLMRTIMVHPALFDRVVAGDEPELLAHELIHVAQWEDDGVCAFLWHYLKDYARLRLLGANHDAAYRGIGYEYQAYAASRRIRETIS